VKELKGFQKVFLKAGESKEVSFTITDEALRFYNSDLKWVDEPGLFNVFIGGNSALLNGNQHSTPHSNRITKPAVVDVILLLKL
jgi:hypothetical protein